MRDEGDDGSAGAPPALFACAPNTLDVRGPLGSSFGVLKHVRVAEVLTSHHQVTRTAILAQRSGINKQ